MGAVARFVSGRRTKWVTLGIWIVLLVIAIPIGQKVSKITDDRQEAFLPKNAESTKVIKLQKSEFRGGETVNALVIYQRAGGLRPTDFAKIAADRRVAAVRLPVTDTPTRPTISRDRSLAFWTLTVPSTKDQNKVTDQGKELRKITGQGAGGLKVYVSGDLGFSADFDEVFGSLDTKLLLATALLVLVLLGIIYRAPLVAISPLLVVFFAYSLAQAGVYAWGKAGNNVNSNGTTILVVLMFGVGTDYCLLLVSRYREELRAHRDKHVAMEVALERVGPAIFASGLTVALAMLVLLVARAGDVRSLGPVAAIGITSAFVAGLTLLPALLTIWGRRGFWPRGRTVAFDPDHHITIKPSMWRRVGDRVVRHPVPALVITTVVVGAGAFGLLAYKEDFSTTNAFKKDVESVDGFKALSRAFPAGTLSPTQILIRRDDGGVTTDDVNAVKARLRGAPGIAAVAPTVLSSEDGHTVQINVILSADPNLAKSLNLIPGMRDRLQNLPPHLQALVGGTTATNYDYKQATTRDFKLIVPLALVVIAIILGLLLNAIVAPIVLIATVILSFLSTLGLSILFIRYVVGDPGINSALPTYAFIFLVALGTDYTIFLMSRVREEARTHGTREGVLRALGATGSVITSAGVILAGTFSVLLTLPVTFAFNIGFIVALGILLDTFIVRTIMVPALVEVIGDKIWWPSTAEGGGRLRERTDVQPEPEPEPAGVG
jgi:putative drug exporter of the RND superfamily